eukprot:gnl/Trimastix_PCT/2138.p2 GENE.gnl/Trimastix_PCT/2138~~gnl/Trimastix_PCT/2138.p2  ORF type:complete len:209 (+),score=38.27 gnl/Trimastix_PCT/2138:165-791(+)
MRKISSPARMRLHIALCALFFLFATGFCAEAPPALVQEFSCTMGIKDKETNATHTSTMEIDAVHQRMLMSVNADGMNVTIKLFEKHMYVFVFGLCVVDSPDSGVPEITIPAGSTLQGEKIIRGIPTQIWLAPHHERYYVDYKRRVLVRLEDDEMQVDMYNYDLAAPPEEHFRKPHFCIFDSDQEKVREDLRPIVESAKGVAGSFRKFF